jgi:AAA15 family ATPase/GTPase
LVQAILADREQREKEKGSKHDTNGSTKKKKTKNKIKPPFQEQIKQKNQSEWSDEKQNGFTPFHQSYSNNGQFYPSQNQGYTPEATMFQVQAQEFVPTQYAYQYQTQAFYPSQSTKQLA